MLTPETLTRHELVGLPVRVADAPNPDLVGISGRVVEETMRTLVVRQRGARDRRVPKRGSTLEFRLDAEPSIGVDVDTEIDSAGTAARDEAASGREATGAAFKREEDTAGVRPGQSFSTDGRSRPVGKPAGGDCEDAVYVTVDGTRLLSRPALRTEHAGDTTWQSD